MTDTTTGRRRFESLPSRVRRFAVRLGFSAWAAVVLVPGAYLMADHLLTLPAPNDGDPRVEAALEEARAPEDRGRWLAVHLMYQDCGCSQRLLAHLLSRGALPDVRERIVLIGHDDALAARAKRAGFSFEELTPEGLAARYHAEAAPMMLVAAPDGKLRYVGGYSDRKRGPDTMDVDILHRLAEGRRVAALPLFGCAVSEKLQGEIDPLGIKYTRTAP